MDSRAKHLVEIGNGLFSAQQPYNSLRQNIAENFYPMRADFTCELPLGPDFQTDVMDSFPVQSRETLGNMPHSMIRQGDWFSISTGDEDRDENQENRAWFDVAKDVMRKFMYAPTAHLSSATIEGDHDYVTFGNAILSVEENSSRNGLIYKAHHPKDNVWMVNADGVIDHNQRALTMTARNVCRNKRWDVHPDIHKICKDKPNQPIKLRHILMSKDEIYGDDKAMKRKFGKMDFISIYIDVEHQQILGQAGMPVFNYIIPGWRKLSNLMYAFSPATLNCLPDGRMLQQLAMIILEQGEKAIDPPAVAREGLFRDGYRAYAGGLTMADLEPDEDLRNAFQIMESKGQLGFGMELKQDVRSLIAESMLLNKLFLPDTKDMTAFETNARLDEVRRAALPFFGPYESEYNLPLLDATFELLLNAGAIPIPPEALHGEEVTFKFEGPLNTLEGRQTVQAYQEVMQMIAGAGQLDQSIIGNYNIPKMTDDAVRGAGAKPDWFTPDDVKKKNADQAAQTAQAVKAAAIVNAGAQTAQAVGDGAQSLQAAGLV